MGRLIFVRVVSVLLVGWWLSFLWAHLAWLLSLTDVGLPVGIRLLHRLPFVTSLYRFHE